MIVWSLTSAFLTFEEVLCLALCSTALQKAEEQLFEYFFFTARKNIDDYWMNLFMSNSEIHRHHAQDVLDSFQNCVLNNKQSDYSFKTLSLFHRLNFVYYPTPEVAKLCQTTCQVWAPEIAAKDACRGAKSPEPARSASRRLLLDEERPAKQAGDGVAVQALQHLSNEMALITRNIKSNGTERCVLGAPRLRIKRPHAELCNKFEELQRIRQQVAKTAKQAEKKRKLANNVNAKVKRMKLFMDQQRSLESMFLKSIR